MTRFVLFWAFFAIVAATAVAQNVANPFEMKHRLAKVASPGTTLKAAPNPFDVKPHRAPGAAQALAENVTKPFQPAFSWLTKGQPLSKLTIFTILVAIVVFLTFSVATNRKVVESSWRGFLNDNGLAVAQREASGFVGITPYFLLYGCFILNATMFIFLVMQVFTKNMYNNWRFLFTCLVTALVIFLSKHLLLRIAGWLFPVGKEVQRYNFLIIIFNCVLGLFLVPLNLLLAVSKKEFQDFWVFWTLGLVGIFYLYRAWRSGSIGTKFLGDNLFHFLLYLCAVEIAPVLLLVKLVMIQTK